MKGGVSLRIVGWAEAEPLVMPLREAVFVVEQGVPLALERDEFDAVSRHAVVQDATGTVIATGRLLPDGHIGRMAVAAGARGHGIGGRVLEALVAEAAARGLPEVVLNAQLQAEAFYRCHGFVVEGGVFLDAGIEHRRMRRVCRR
jgi:predicted GNAT family N-acyltransferase